MLTGVTLAIGVGTWMLSPIKFQADMGILLAFMFIWNMVGALILLPALAYFLLPPTPGDTNNAGNQLSTIKQQELRDTKAPMFTASPDLTLT
ncbi:hypothetical protein D3C87_1823200 [compost metagenome]